jgi:hypothetical protein
MKEAFVLSEFLRAGLAFDGAARAIIKRGCGVNCTCQATISSPRTINIYESASKCGWVFLHLSLSKLLPLSLYPSLFSSRLRNL